MVEKSVENGEIQAQSTKKGGVKYFFVRDYADKANNPDADSSRLSETRFTAPFSMKEMHAVQRQYLESRNKLIHCIERPEKLSDFLADVVATAHAKSRLSGASDSGKLHGHEHNQIAGGISMYTGALYEHGYNQKDYSDFNKIVTQYLGESGILVWIIAGTQDEYLLERRAEAAAKAFVSIKEKDTNVRHFIAFCGAHPPTDRVDLSNEAFRLKCLFIQKTSLAESSSKSQKPFLADNCEYTLIEENKSRNTEENIKHAMNMFFSSNNKDDSITADARINKRKYGVIIVSNDFHLIRLGRDFRKHRHSEDMTKKERENTLDFSALFLLGSEYFNINETQVCITKSLEFSKRFTFEALSDFFRSNYFLSDATYLYSPPSDSLPDIKNVPFVDSLAIPAIPSETDKKAGIVEFVLRYNRLVFNPVDHSALYSAVEQKLLSLDSTMNNSADASKLHTVYSLSGRFSQPTVRISGEPRIVKNKDGQLTTVRLDLATNYEGVSFASQFGILKLLDTNVRDATSKHQLLSLFTSVLYVFEKNNTCHTLLRKRKSNKYAFENAWEASIEGPIYKDDFKGRDLFDVRTTVLRLFKKDYLKQLQSESVQIRLRDYENSKSERWKEDFKLTGMSHSIKHGQSYIHGYLQGPELLHRPEEENLYSHVEIPEEVALNSDALMAFFQTKGTPPDDLRIMPCVIVSILYALDNLVGPNERQKFLNAFTQQYSMDKLESIFRMHKTQ